MSPLRTATAVVALVALAASLAAAGVRASYGARTTGDEPHYLVTALSLAEDGDLDVADELAEGAYRPFHEAELAPQGAPRADGTLVEPHDPLLPALLAGPVAAAGWVGAKLALAAVAAALAALTLWTAVRRFDAPVAPAALVVGVFAASSPLAVYGAQVYPELPAALAATAGAAALAGSFRGRAQLVLAAAVVALPWLAVKYAPVAAALALLALVRLGRGGERRSAAALATGLAAAAAAFLVLHRAWYGGWTPYAAGEHFVGGELTAAGHEPDLLGRSRRLVGLLVDRYFGLAAWQPAWLVAAAALGGLARARPRGWAALVVPWAAGWLVATVAALTMQGWWWPGRQVVVVLPLLVVAVAWWAGGSRARVAAVAALGAAGIASYGWVLADAWLGRLTLVVDFYETTFPWYRAWRTLLPDYFDVTALTWALHWSWAGVLLALVAAGWRAASPGRARAPSAASLSA